MKCNADLIFSFQVREFYKNFPPDKIPKVGEAGEIYREKQLLHQIPKQVSAIKCLLIKQACSTF